MSSSILLILEHTPWWVFVLFFYCLWIGLKARKPHVLPLWKMFIIPLVFVYLSLHTLIHALSPSATIYLTYTIALFIGMVLGAIQLFFQKIQVDRASQRIHISGSWFTLIIILIIFASKYTLGYQMASDPMLLHNTTFELTLVLISALTSGMFVGRLLFCLWRFIKGPFVTL